MGWQMEANDTLLEEWVCIACTGMERQRRRRLEPHHFLHHQILNHTLWMPMLGPLAQNLRSTDLETPRPATFTAIT